MYVCMCVVFLCVYEQSKIFDEATPGAGKVCVCVCVRAWMYACMGAGKV